MDLDQFDNMLNGASAAEIRYNLDIERIAGLSEYDRRLAVKKLALSNGFTLGQINSDLKAYVKQAGPRINTPPNTENGLADFFATMTDEAKDYRHVEGDDHHWHQYTNGLWVRGVNAPLDMMRRVAARYAPKDKNIHRAAALNGALRLAATDPKFAVTGDIFDTDKYLLHTPAGVVDLRTGKMREHRREDLMTLSTHIKPQPIAGSRWAQFIPEIMQDDDEVTWFMQDFAGYGLTGDTSEQCFVFLYGEGGNGKGMFANALIAAMGTYGKNAPTGMFEDTGVERHPTEFAGLYKKRLVTASETKDGAYWHDLKLKIALGQDPIEARFMRQDFFSFLPEFKLLAVGNFKPRIRTLSRAIRRRFWLVPMNLQVLDPEEANGEAKGTIKRDRSLHDLFRTPREQGAILQWAIDGAVRWWSNRERNNGQGLLIPQAVRDATEEYFREQDPLNMWKADHCAEGPVFEDKNTGKMTTAHWASTADLYASFRRHQIDMGVPPHRIVDQMVFGKMLAKAGYRSHKDRHGTRGFAGISLTKAGMDAVAVTY